MDEQRLAQLLDSNSPLHPLELSFLRQDIQVREGAMQNLQMQIDALKTEYETLQSQCRAHRSLLSPLRRSAIPLELLGEIFCEVLEASGMEETRQVSRICLVCKAWRNVALATPRLWVSAWVDIRKPIEFNKVETWLSRSGTLPKRLSVIGQGHTDKTHAECPLLTPGLAKSLAAGPAKFAELSLFCDSPKCCQDLFKSVLSIETKSPRPWDSLQSLELDVAMNWGNEGADFSHLLPRSLTSLFLDLPDPDELPQGIPRPKPISHPSVSQLAISSAFWPVDWILKTLIGFTSLSELTLDFKGLFLSFEEGPFLGDKPYSFPGIRIFKLYGLYWPQSEKTRILRFFSMPSLAEFEMSFQTDNPRDRQDLDLPAETIADIAQFSHLSNGLPRLHYLALSEMAVSGPGLNRILKSFASITHLCLESVSINASGPNSLGFDNELVPRLQILEILDFPIQGWTAAGGLMQFIQARSLQPTSQGTDTGISTIRKVTLSVARPSVPTFYFDFEHWSKTMAKAGIDFSFVPP